VRYFTLARVPDDVHAVSLAQVQQIQGNLSIEKQRFRMKFAYRPRDTSQDDQL
jgi:hypothetical protein